MSHVWHTSRLRAPGMAALLGLPPARCVMALLAFVIRRIAWAQLATAPAQVHAPCEVRSLSVSAANGAACPTLTDTPACCSAMPQLAAAITAAFPDIGAFALSFPGDAVLFHSPARVWQRCPVLARRPASETAFPHTYVRLC